MEPMAEFASFDDRCKALGLTNADQAIVLGVTTTMIYRYRLGGTMPALRRHVKFSMADRVLKFLEAENMEGYTPDDRFEAIGEALLQVGAM